MEVEVAAHSAGRVARLPISEGASIGPGQPLVVLTSEEEAES